MLPKYLDYLSNLHFSLLWSNYRVAKAPYDFFQTLQQDSIVLWELKACVGVRVYVCCFKLSNFYLFFSLPPTPCRLFQKRSMVQWSAVCCSAGVSAFRNDRVEFRSAFKVVFYSLKTDLSSQSSSPRHFHWRFMWKPNVFCAVLCFILVAVKAFVRSRHVKAPCWEEKQSSLLEWTYTL